MTFARIIRSVLLTVVSTNAVFAQQNSAAKGTDAAAESFFLYAGSFTGTVPPNGFPDGKPLSKGIYMARFQAGTGALSEPVLVAEVSNPSFLAVTPDQRFLYAVTEAGPEAFVSAYAIDPHTGALRLLNRLPTGGSGTAYVSVDRTGRFVLLANYGSSSVTVIETASDGALGKLTSFVQHTPARAIRGSVSGTPSQPAVPHPHAMAASPDNRFVLVPDLGLNRVLVYPFDAGVLRLPAHAVDVEPDEEPRHFVFSPDGAFGYLNGQKRGNVDVFRWDATAGTLSPVQTVESFPKGLDAFNMSAELAITPNGKFLYESNRRTHGAARELGPDSLVAFQVNRQTGTLTQVQDVDLGTALPRCFSIDPTGGYLFLSGEQSNAVDVYRIDPEHGTLAKSGVSIYIHSPACMQFARAQ